MVSTVLQQSAGLEMVSTLFMPVSEPVGVWGWTEPQTLGPVQAPDRTGAAKM